MCKAGALEGAVLCLAGRTVTHALKPRRAELATEASGTRLQDLDLRGAQRVPQQPTGGEGALGEAVFQDREPIGLPRPMSFQDTVSI